MSHVRHAAEFLQQIQRLRGDYERLYRPRVESVRAQYTPNPTGNVPPLIDECLEAHIRAYLVNGFLAALNWHITLDHGLPNLVPESPVRSLERGTTRFLDYLGMDNNAGRPLLLVETKRPKAQLPGIQATTASRNGTSAEIICTGLHGDDIGAEWNGYLDVLRDYVRSIQARFDQCPRRVVITNGDWLVLFTESSYAFLDDNRADPSTIFVYLDRADIERRYAELFQLLEYTAVVGTTPFLTVEELAFHVDGHDVTGVMHGIRLMYIEEPGILDYRPQINIMPVVLVHTTRHGWIFVHSQHELQIPHNYRELDQHLQSVQDLGVSLMQRVQEILNLDLPVTSLVQHYRNESEFQELKGVIRQASPREPSVREYIVATGDQTHYFRARPTVPDCPYHSWPRSIAEGVAANPDAIFSRRIRPISFFVSEELHHCTHREVSNAKTGLITPANREQCGRRSGQDGEAFCEIISFEEFLCCRTCVFEDVCTRATVFRLPCQRPNDPVV